MLVFREPFRYDQEASDSSAGGAEALAETEKPFQVWAGPASVASQMHWEKQSPGACVPSPCRGRWGSGCVYGAEASSWRLSTHEGPFSWQQLGSASCRSPGAGRHHPGLRSFYRCHQQGAPLGQREANHITLGLACCLQSERLVFCLPGLTGNTRNDTRLGFHCPEPIELWILTFLRILFL